MDVNQNLKLLCKKKSGRGRGPVGGGDWWVDVNQELK